MIAPNATVKDVAQEAEFQLGCARDVSNWHAALNDAMVQALREKRPEAAITLGELSNFLYETTIAGLESSIDDFSELAAQKLAPQKRASSVRGAGGVA